MSSIAIRIPELEGEQDVEVQVKINGEKRQYNYRVEIFRWEDCPYPTEDRVECIKKLVADYDSDWDLAHIGVPTDVFIPITFKKKRVIQGSSKQQSP